MLGVGTTEPPTGITFATKELIYDRANQSQRRIKQLERCLNAVRDMTTERYEELFRFHGEASPVVCETLALINRITNRINRIIR